MADENFSLADENSVFSRQLRQRLLTWSGHAESWTGQKEIPVFVIRYEDMKTKPLDIFSGAIKFLGFNFAVEEIKKAIEFSDFSVLQEQEKKNGFKEKKLEAEAFFWKGDVGYWRSILTRKQSQKIIDDHRDVMLKFGYLNKRGKPIY